MKTIKKTLKKSQTTFEQSSRLLYDIWYANLLLDLEKFARDHDFFKVIMKNYSEQEDEQKNGE